jgi:hypothetical protein
MPDLRRLAAKPRANMLMEDLVDQFNRHATELQTTEFRCPRTPGEWQRRAENPPNRDYAKLFDAVVPLIQAFELPVMQSVRSAVAAKLNPDGLCVLRTFAGSMAILAVRRNAPELIGQGLTALAILGDIDDTRDLMFYLATLHYSGAKLGADTERLFQEKSALSPSLALQAVMSEFPLRPPEARSLKAFGLRETATNEGFDFVANNPGQAGGGARKARSD